MALAAFLVALIAWGPLCLLITVWDFLRTRERVPWGNGWVVSNMTIRDWLFAGEPGQDWRGLKFILLWLEDKVPYPTVLFVLVYLIDVIVARIRRAFSGQ